MVEAKLKLQADTEVELKVEKEMKVRIEAQSTTIDQEVNNASEYIHECEEKVEYSTRKSLELLR